MSKKALKTEPAPEVLHPGQPSTALLARLKSLAEQATDERIGSALQRCEEARGQFHFAAIECGLLLLARKQTLRHGQFQKFAAGVWGSYQKQIGSACPISNHDNFTRSMRRYMFLAQHFLADLEQKAFQPEEGSRVEAGPEIQPEEVMSLATLPKERRVAVGSAIAQWVGGRSLRRMLIDMRRAESAAEVEEASEAASSRRKSAAENSAEAEADETGRAMGFEGQQLELWRDYAQPLTMLDRLLADDKSAAMTNRDFWKTTTETLRTLLRKAEQRLKESKS